MWNLNFHLYVKHDFSFSYIIWSIVLSIHLLTTIYLVIIIYNQSEYQYINIGYSRMFSLALFILIGVTE